jgi:hypothetical protein
MVTEPQQSKRLPDTMSAREVEMQVLSRAHEDAIAENRSKVVLVVGPDGFGKSHLLGAFSTGSQRLVLNASVVDRTGSFALFNSIMEQALGYLRQQALDEPKLRSLSLAVHQLRHEPGASADRASLFESVVEIFELVSRAFPVLIFDDVDKADKSSHELLKFVLGVAAAPGSKLKMLFVLAHAEKLPRSLGNAAVSVGAKSIQLKGFDVEGIRQFLQGSDVASRLYELTQGNPEVLTELLERPMPSAEFLVKRFERLGTAAKQVITALTIFCLFVQWPMPQRSICWCTTNSSSRNRATKKPPLFWPAMATAK